MDFIGRQYKTDDDYWRIRAFFRNLRAEDLRPSVTWNVADFDYWRWHTLENVWERDPHELAYWEDQRGEIIAVLVYGDPGVCHPMAAPKAVTAELLHAMLEKAESEFPWHLDDGRGVLFPWSQTDDVLLNTVLETRGYELGVGGHAREYHGWCALKRTPLGAKTRRGYSLRSMGELDDLPSRSLASWRVHHPGEPDEGADPKGAWYQNVQRAPLYRRDLDVVAVDDSSGHIVAFSTCYFDDVTRTGTILLTGAAQPHPVEDLERAVIAETLRRLHWLGAIGAYLSWFESGPGAVYESAGFEVGAISHAWRKFF